MPGLRFDTEQDFQRFLTAYQKGAKALREPLGRTNGGKNDPKATPTPTDAAKRQKGRVCATEEQEQEALIQWARLNVHSYPALDLLAHIPNGGSRHVLEAKKLKRLGVLSGMPDLLLLYPARDFHGWVGEMKAEDGKLTEKQYSVLLRLRSHGYFAEMFHGWEKARDSLVWYLTGPLNAN